MFNFFFFKYVKWFIGFLLWLILGVYCIFIEINFLVLCIVLNNGLFFVSFVVIIVENVYFVLCVCFVLNCLFLNVWIFLLVNK